MVRAVVQRVTRARGDVEGRVTGEIGAGLAVLIAVGRGDSAETAAAMAEKIVRLRIFNDEQGKMNRSLLDAGGAVLVVSQFTLYGDARGQRR
ncbi:MAG: D-aminoacyl-tRNA deacylase, partial [Candidatus Acidiferrales bacterium]